ncbi:MAG TPA: DinB family protein [Terriglobia bacterium]|nr:DinB family protein [Terriglobia bacterium]
MLKHVFDVLASTPEKLRREISTMTPREMKAAPAEGKWSVQVVLAHLEDVESVAMRGRVEAMVTQDNPFLKSFDQVARAVELHYDRRDPKRSLASFTRQRTKNLRWLRTLRPSHLKRKGMHEKVGEVSVAEFLHEWAFHDLGHLKQILEIKRYALFPRMGNMRKFYQLS